MLLWEIALETLDGVITFLPAFFFDGEEEEEEGRKTDWG